jgi:hypothetical protein
MPPSHTLAPLILAKLREQINRTEHLLAHIPGEQAEWQPTWPTPEPSQGWPMDRLFGHPGNCLVGFCAALYAAHRHRLAHFDRLRTRSVNHHCGLEEARQRIHLVTTLQLGYSRYFRWVSLGGCVHLDL